MSILSGVNPIKVDLFRADNGLPLWTTNLDKTLPALTQQTYNTKQPNTDLIFVEDEEQQRLSVAALIDGSHVAYVENGKVLWSWNNDLGALVLHRLTTSGNKLVAVGTTGSELAVLGFHLVDGDRFTTGFLKLGSAAVPGQIIVVGEKMERYVVILTENNRVQILDLRTETLTDLATKQSDFNPTRRLISGLVQLGTESTLMQDFIVQFVDHSEVVVRLSSQEGFTVLTTPQTKSASVILTQGYLEDFYAYARVEEISPTETALSFIDLDTGALLEAHQFEHNTKEHGSIISGYIDIQIDSNGFVVWQLAAATSKGTLVSWKGTNVEAVAQDEVNPSFAALQDGHDEADNIDDDDDEEEPYYVHYSIKQKMPKTKAPEHKEL
ncbi:uncharacterized protein BJ171DRAFT_273019 [Polychytrium aggregatum]|uniref:uncharacterized protein n=1 Tax=Polychytrium aggregatum TaxID=110093 RepID=UPI0022FDE203|nr:uncharacterized protein BJ171DRAFT_273019 [Polychytrium aggregatum]KAI9193343.1 hypothetical protein BJ171DRAFT_273019 [Polychytrium aggregatum]